LGIPVADIIKVSGKTGENVPSVLDEIIAKIPAPTALPLPVIVHDATLSPARQLANSQPVNRCLIFDSVFDPYK